tara:strand:- start:4245 stop:4970 length:726 start_codon:yes stop_codon:yes gene_type:complete
MFDNVITFSAPKKYIDLKENLPKPIKFNMPEWYKKLKHDSIKSTIKGCMPFLETISTGYLLELPLDITIKHNIKNEEDNRDSIWFQRLSNISYIPNLNINQDGAPHNTKQLEGSPIVKKNLNYNIYKILNPWKITTPPGYSCLFVPPLNNSDDRFSIIPGIVQTDKHPIEVNFPFIINGDKYPILDTILKKGTPYVQVIPFKRESWKMKISDRNSTKNNFKWGFFNINNYKTNVWSRIKFN